MPIKPGWQGRYYEDFEVGDVYQYRIGRTITESDNTWFSLVTLNLNQIHFNADYAARTEFKKPLVNSVLTLAIVTGMTVEDVSENGINLGWDEVRLPSPVFVGDTLYAETEVLEKRESRSRPQQGIVHIKTRGIKQDGIVVIEFKRSIMVWKKAHATARDPLPKVKETYQAAETGSADFVVSSVERGARPRSLP